MRAKRLAQFNRSQIDIGNAEQMRYWSKHLGVTRDELRTAVEKVGNSASTVRKELAARNSIEPQQPET